MTSRPIVATRPYTVVVLVTLGLIVLLGVGGTVIYLAQLPLSSPVALVFTPVAIALIGWATLTRRWGTLGFGAPAGIGADRMRWLPVVLPMIVVLVLVVATIGGVADQPGTAWLGLLGFVLLVGFVEETLFRSVFLTILAPKGHLAAVLVSTAAFALAHAANLLGGQDLASTLGQIAFAAAFGLFAACVFLRTGSIWPTIAFHALYDLVQLARLNQEPLAVDGVMTLVLLAGALWLWAGIRAADRATDPQAGTAPAVAGRAR